MDAIDRFFAATEQAEAAVREMFSALNEAGADMAEDKLPRLVRSIDNAISEAHDEVEEMGLTP